VGDTIAVMVTEIDEQGRINLSRRDALIQVEGLTPEESAPREESARPASRQGGFRRRDNRRRED
jgi:polyribonucleotide nucleotidyltransferase